MRNLVVPPEAKIFGDLEIDTRFGLWALSGKAVVISKSISKVLVFLETTLETDGANTLHLHGDLAGRSAVWDAARKETRRAAALPPFVGADRFAFESSVAAQDVA